MDRRQVDASRIVAVDEGSEPALAALPAPHQLGLRHQGRGGQDVVRLFGGVGFVRRTRSHTSPSSFTVSSTSIQPQYPRFITFLL